MKVLGSGLFSKVYLVKLKNKSLMAMKVIKKKDFKTREQIKKIVTEKELMRIMRHRNILMLNNTFQSKDKLYLILEYAAKGRLIRQSHQIAQYENVPQRVRNQSHCGSNYRGIIVYPLQRNHLRRSQSRKCVNCQKWNCQIM